jgi:hypothetical protein
MKMINYSFNGKKFVKKSVSIRPIFEQIFQAKKVYQAKKFGIRSLFVPIQYEIDQIVKDWLNIEVTYT